MIKLSFDLNSNPTITANAGIDKIICEGDSIQLGIMPQVGYNYLWSSGAGTQSNPYVAPTVTTTYILTVSSLGLCALTATDTDTIVVTVLSAPHASFSYSFDCDGLTTSFLNTSSIASNSEWNFGDGSFSFAENPVHVYEEPGSYPVMLVVNAGNNCSDTVLASVIIDDSSIDGLLIPNAFTPNNDGQNDYFEIKSETLCEMINIKIFSRWGQQIFESENRNFKWDGKHNGADVPDGVYYYIFKGRIKKLTGSVSVFR